MAIGNPIAVTNNVAYKIISATATADQTLFLVVGGYRVNQLAVFLNGVRLRSGDDFTANDGASVTLLTAASIGDILEFQIFDTFSVADAIRSSGDQALAGTLDVTEVVVGSAVTINSTGIDAGAGIITATSFFGSGANLTDVISGVELQFDGNSVGTAITQVNFAGVGSVTAPVSGLSTVTIDASSKQLTIGVRVGSAVTFNITGDTFNVSNRAGGNTAISV